MNLADITQPLLDKLESWADALVGMLPNTVVAIVVLLLFVVLSRYVSRAVVRGLGRVVESKQLVGLFGQIVRLGLLAAGAFVALSVLHLDKAVTSLLAGVGIVGLALGFAFQDIAANFVSGVLMAVRRPFTVDDLVKVSDFFGRVETINLRATRLTQLSGETVIIPNKDVFQNAIVNYTETKCRRVELEVGVSYGDDLDKAKQVAIEAVRSVRPRDESRDVELFYTGFGGSSIDFQIRFWIEDAEQLAYLDARSKAVMAIKKAFDDHEITIPFPIRTLDFGIVGGERLHEHLGRYEEAAQ